MPRFATILELLAAALLVGGLIMVWVPLGVIAMGVLVYLLSLAMEASE